MDYWQQNAAHHDQAFKQGYGIHYPEGHIIRVYERILKYELGIDGSKGEKLLDFGCGNATHSSFFRSKGFDIYGVDADATAIRRCRESFPEISGHFEVIDPKPLLERKFFGHTYDVILANQVLYYFSNPDLEACLRSLHSQLRTDGVFIASMMGPQHYFYRHSEEASEGLRRVSLSGRTKAISLINFTYSKEDLLEKFRLFKPISIGYYDFQIREEEGSSFHYLFVGRKES
ncbi:MAG: class I SAM-dependent methyltransferase [Deltaproteobacteria bacterium]|nr:class I SAM-dependent methyltransferase [Deltaproteobacteria bacterium]